MYVNGLHQLTGHHSVNALLIGHSRAGVHVITMPTTAVIFMRDTCCADSAIKYRVYLTV